jgi:lambda repressor-like predicted transcriptional regulator
MLLCPRLPAEPLKRVLRNTMKARSLCWESLAVRLGVSSRTLLRVMKATTVSPYVADHIAIRLGTHPALIWPNEWGRASAPRPRRGECQWKSA